jgi:hypothetical protein
MADVDLTPMDPKMLPPIAYASAEDVLPPYPRNFKAVRNLEDLIRPDHGLWCSPVTTWSEDGVPTATAWTDWCGTPDEQTGLLSGLHDRYTKFTAVEPLPHARIYLIDTADDLDRLVAAFRLPPEHQMHRTAPDWEAMAASGWDAVYVSTTGLAANEERWPICEPSLARWDCPSVLWLRPAYRLTTLLFSAPGGPQVIHVRARTRTDGLTTGIPPRAACPTAGQPTAWPRRRADLSHFREPDADLSHTFPLFRQQQPPHGGLCSA